MSNTYYTSLTGMLAASYGLQNASNNVANMKSSGYKRTDVFYSSLGNGSGHNSLGSGVYIGGQNINFSQGNHQETGSPSDLAIVGNGFFVVQLQNGELLYTRDGEFGFNNEGFLIDNHSKGLVQGYDQQGNLVPISQFGPKIFPGKATHTIDLKGEFIVHEKEEAQPPNSTEQPKITYPPIEFKVTVFDEIGKSHVVNLKLKASDTIGEYDGKHWVLESAMCDDGTPVEPDYFTVLEFNDFGNGSALVGSNLIKFTLNETQQITLNFGDAYKGENSSVLFKKYVATDDRITKIEELKQDGYHFGKQIDFAFDDNGQISYIYDNGKSTTGHYVALALFNELENTLVQAQDNLFRAKNTDGLSIGRANKGSFGTIKPKYVESSNVDPTNEFANIVVLQRMFQSCSQIMDIEKQLLEEMYKK